MANPSLISTRKAQWQEITAINNVPYLVYGNDPGELIPKTYTASAQELTGIGASPGEITGIVKIISNLNEVDVITKEMIVVVPYADSGWGAFLARAGGIIAEVGGRLSHGAIIAREYGIPAIMDVENVTQILKDGQRITMNGKKGVIKILE